MAVRRVLKSHPGKQKADKLSLVNNTTTTQPDRPERRQTNCLMAPHTADNTLFYDSKNF
ncbi:MAG: hypothetical protein AAGC45_11955 [Bacteroidota bacterium]